MSVDQATIARWDEWFTACGMSRVWNEVKTLFPNDLPRQNGWATILELNRIDDAIEQKRRSGGTDATTMRNHQQDMEGR